MKAFTQPKKLKLWLKLKQISVQQTEAAYLHISKNKLRQGIYGTDGPRMVRFC